jgi:hypothetical protein
MDERALGLAPGAGKAELHQAPGETGNKSSPGVDHNTDGVAEEGQLGRTAQQPKKQ